MIQTISSEDKMEEKNLQHALAAMIKDQRQHLDNQINLLRNDTKDISKDFRTMMTAIQDIRIENSKLDAKVANLQGFIESNISRITQTYENHTNALSSRIHDLELKIKETDKTINDMSRTSGGYEIDFRHNTNKILELEKQVSENTAMRFKFLGALIIISILVPLVTTLIVKSILPG